jgi:uncharacterized protein (DUF1800 family)
MGDENTILTSAATQHLLRRSGFGAPPYQVAQLTGLTRAEAVDRVLNFRAQSFKPSGRYIENRQNSWLKRMISAPHPLQEKLVLFWHDHFATSNDKVGDPALMGSQNQLLRKFCKGNLRDLVKAINRDAAMIEFLDTVRNRKTQPNENYARELQELFTLGLNDFNGQPNYTQADIVQIARAFTGWRYDDRGRSYFDPTRHDYMSAFPRRGPKVIYQSTGGFGSGGRSFTVNGESTAENPNAEIDAVVDIMFDHTDTAGKKTVARFIAGKLFTYFAQPNPKRQLPASLHPVIDALISASGFDTSWDIAALLRAIFVRDAFYATAVPAPFGANTIKSVKWPVDYVVSTLRLLKMRPKGRYQYIDGGSYANVADLLDNMGQSLFTPPSVFGWDWENAWISSVTMLARYTFARDLISARGGGSRSFRPQLLMDLSLTEPGAIVDAVTDALGVTDQFTAQERQYFINYITGNGTNLSLDLNDYDTRNEKLHGLFALVMQSPAYQVH